MRAFIACAVVALASLLAGATPHPHSQPESQFSRGPLDDPPSLPSSFPYAAITMFESEFNNSEWDTTTVRKWAWATRGYRAGFHLARMFTANGRANLNAIHAYQDANGLERTTFIGYEFFKHVRNYNPAGTKATAPLWYANHDSFGYNYVLEDSAGNDLAVWSIGSPVVGYWYGVDDWDENRPDWNYMAKDYVIGWVDNIAKYAGMWQDVPWSGIFFDYTEPLPFDNVGLFTSDVGAGAGGTGSYIGPADFDDDGDLDLWTGAYRGWLDPAMGLNYSAVNDYAVKHLQRVFPDKLLLVNGTAGEWTPCLVALHDSIGTGAGANEELDYYYRGAPGDLIASNFELTAWNNSAIGRLTYRERIDAAYCLGPWATFEYDTTPSDITWGVGLGEMEKIRANVIASLLAGCFSSARQHESNASSNDITVWRTIVNEYANVGDQVGDLIRQDLGSGEMRYIRQYENGWARIRFASTGYAVSADSCEFDFN